MKDVNKVSTLDSIENFILDNARALVGTAIGIAIAAAAYSVFSYVQDKKENEAQIALFKADQLVEKLNKDAQPKVDPKDKKPPQAPVEADLTPAIKSYTDVETSFPKSTAAVIAAHRASDILIAKKNYAEAEKDLRMVLPSLSSGRILSALTRLKLAGVLENLNKCGEAIGFLEPLSNDQDFLFLKSEVLLRIGLCQEKLGDAEKAKSTYQKVSKEFPTSPAGQLAEKYLLLLSLTAKG